MFDDEFRMELRRIFIKKAKIFDMDYVDIALEVKVFPCHYQTPVEDLSLSQIQITKEVFLMTYTCPL